MSLDQPLKNKILDAAKIDVWEAYSQEQRLILGDSVSQWLGLSKTELTYSEFSKLIEPKNPSWFQSHLGQLISGNCEIFETPIQTKLSNKDLVMRFTLVEQEQEANENVHLTGWLSLSPVEKLNTYIDPQILSSVFESFLDNKKIAVFLEDVLNIILKQFNACSVKAYDFGNEKSQLKCICEVATADCKKTTEKTCDETLDSVKWIIDYITQHKQLILNDVDDFLNKPENKEKHLRDQKVKSMMVAPLYHKNDIWGYVEMDTISSRKWETDEFNWFSAYVNAISTFFLLKEEQEKFSQAKTKAEELSRLKSAFLNIMGHEIRTSLNAIVGFSNILATTENKKQKKEYLNIIENNNKLLLQIVSDIINSSKLEEGSLEIQETEFDVNLLLWELEQSSKQKLLNKNVEIAFIEQLPKCKLFTDKNRFMQIFEILINNAIRFTQNGYIHFGYKLKEGNELYFYMSDSSCGISQKDAEKLLLSVTDSKDFEVITESLSLHICKALVTKLGGKIGINSVEGRGTIFWFTLPYDVDINDLKVVSSINEVEKLKPIILIAEDDPGNFRLLEITYRGKYNIIHAWDGLEAINMFKEHRPNLILMDIRMPKVDGYISVNEIRKISKTVPIIAVTSYVYEEDEKKILSSGFDYYIAKPINKINLEKKIEEYLDKSVNC